MIQDGAAARARLEQSMREETNQKAWDGKNPLDGYMLMGCGPDGDSMWVNPKTRHILHRDPDGSVMDPDRMASPDFMNGIAATQEKWRER